MGTCVTFPNLCAKVANIIVDPHTLTSLPFLVFRAPGARSTDWGETTVYPLRSWSCKQWSVWLYIMLDAECKRRERRRQFSTSDAGNNVT